MSETREQVFMELLQAWRDDEDSIIAERSHDMTADSVRANREMMKWEQRYRDAEPDHAPTAHIH
jgi:hypothetical protein